MGVIDDYLQKLEQPEHAMLQHIREVIHHTVPNLEETFAYGLPTLKYKGKNLIHFSAFKDHMSIFPGGKATAALADKLTGYKTSKGTVQFTLDNPIPDDLLVEIVNFGKSQIDAT
jgi:uncharacterized protein YdhG (YjbR/CyaY superfamily)